jgi:hypothetical protein
LGAEPFGAAIVFRITRSRINGNRFAAPQQLLVGGIVVAFWVWLCFRLQFDLATTGSVNLILIALLSLMGSFMGLSICRSIIEAHDGRLWAMPNVPHGAAFRFTLPANRGDAP